jgi:hypothetical protein
MHVLGLLDTFMNPGFKMGLGEDINYVYCKIQHAEVSIHVYINAGAKLSVRTTYGEIPHGWHKYLYKTRSAPANPKATTHNPFLALRPTAPLALPNGEPPEDVPVTPPLEDVAVLVPLNVEWGIVLVTIMVFPVGGALAVMLSGEMLTPADEHELENAIRVCDKSWYGVRQKGD